MNLAILRCPAGHEERHENHGLLKRPDAVARFLALLANDLPKSPGCRACAAAGVRARVEVTIKGAA